MAARKIFGWLGPRAVGIALAVALGAVSSQALAVTDADRIEVYKDFLKQYQAKKYAEAEPFAEMLVKLTEQQYGTDELQLTTPLTNLGTVYYKLGKFPKAIENYQRSLRILQAKSTIADKAQIRPLHGLGVSFMATNDPESAVVALKRAADLSRNTDGLFNINQVEFIDPLIDAYGATGRYAEAEKEALYAMRVEEAAYGRTSVKLLGRLDKLARWYEEGRRYTSERNVYDRALGILAKEGGGNDIRRVGPLRGIARAFRLEAFYGPEGSDSNTSFSAGNGGVPVINDATSQRRGESSLTTALEIVDGNSPVDQKLRGEVLADLGDWYLIANSSRRAFDSYAEAWKSFTASGSTQYLEKPRILAYRPSISSVDRSQLDPSEAVLKTVEMHVKVDRDGRVLDVTSPTTDVPENIVKNSLASMKRSRYAPRIENGAAVATDDVLFIERVLIKAPQDGDQPSGKAAEKPAEAKTQESAPADSKPESPADSKPEQGSQEPVPAQAPASPPKS